MVTQELIRGFPPSFQAQLDAMPDEARRHYLREMTHAERKEQRKHAKMRKAWMNDFGEDIGPYESIYDLYWRIEEKQHASKNGDLALLNLDVDAALCKRDVKNAYRRQARKLHPDVGGSDADFKALHTAYRTVLSITPA